MEKREDVTWFQDVPDKLSKTEGNSENRERGKGEIKLTILG